MQLKTIRCEHARRNRLFADADSNAILLCNLLCSPHRISEATFLGINLGSTSLILTGVAGILYYAQSLLMQVGMDEEQKKQMKTMALMNPIMIMMFSFGSPAGVTLYWVVGGLFGILQQAITNFILKPRIRKQVEEEFKNITVSTTPRKTKDVTPTASAVIEEKDA